MDTIEVTARFDSQGNITPISFTWQGSVYTVESIGRRWEAKDGLHMLVMVVGNRAYHLVYNGKSKTWKLIRGTEIPTVPRV
jgi:hypothetical protein